VLGAGALVDRALRFIAYNRIERQPNVLAKSISTGTRLVLLL
jgi:hypothetical protein